MIELRPYQTECVNQILRAATEGVSRQLISLPTGSGKTIIFATLVAQTVKAGGRCLILTHRDELVHQTLDKLRMIAPGLPIGVVKAERNEFDRPVVIASQQTLARDNRLQQLPRDWQLLIVDEAHHVEVDEDGRGNSWVGIIEYISAPLTVGFTATPFRANGESVVGEAFERTVYQKHLLNMIVDGNLTDITARRLFVEGFHLKGVRSVAGDYSASDLGERLMEANAPVQIDEGIQTYAADRRVGVFSPTKAHAAAVAAACMV